MHKRFFQPIFATCMCWPVCISRYFALARLLPLQFSLFLWAPFSAADVAAAAYLPLSRSLALSFCLLGNFITCPQTGEGETENDAQLSTRPLSLGQQLRPQLGHWRERESEHALSLERRSRARAARRRFRGSLSCRHICVVSFGFVRSELLFGSLRCAADREATRAVCWLNFTLHTHTQHSTRRPKRRS